jgi:hypothetical protein
VEREYSIIGRGLTEEDKQGASEALEVRRKRGIEPKEGELEKSPEDIKLINLLGTLIDQNLKEAGAENLAQVDASQFHFLEKSRYRELLGRPILGSAMTHALSQEVFISSDELKGPGNKIEILAHEIAHLKSKIKYESKDIDEERSDLNVYRSGYHTTRGDKDHFLGLNEAVTQFIAAEVLLENKEILSQTTGIDPEEFENDYGVYESYRRLTREIIQGLADHYDVESDKIWNKIKREYVNGNMMFLRRIDKVFGKGALRVVSSFNQGNTRLRNRQLVERTITFLKSTNQEERDKIAAAILSPEDLHMYLKRR